MSVTSPPRLGPTGQQRPRPPGQAVRRHPPAPPPPPRTGWGLSLSILLLYLVVISTLSALFDGPSWWLGVATLGTAILMAAEAVRAMGARPWVGLLSGGLVGIASIVLFFGDTTTIALVIPTFETFELFGQLLSDGAQSIARQDLPADADLGIRFILAIGAGLFAVLLDAQAIVGRMPALVAIPTAGIALVPSIVSGDVNLLPLVLCCAAFLLVLWSDTRSRNGARRPPSGMVGIGVFAVIGALVAALMAPGFNGESLIASSGSVFGHGVSPLVDLGKDLRRPGGAEQFRYTTTSTESLYFRLLTLDRFDGTTWSASSGRDTLLNEEDTVMTVPGLTGEIQTETAVTDVQVAGMEAPWLPVPFPSVRVTGINGRWLWDVEGLTLSSRLASASRQDYSAESVLIQPTREQLIAAPSSYPDEVGRFLELPDVEIPPIIQESLAEAIGTTDNGFDKAFAIQQFLRSTAFIYSLEAPVDDGYDGDGLDVIAAFLEKKAGYCVHFASTMAIMARMAGIPARVSLGYLPGDRFGPTGSDERSYVVGTDDLHSWPELYFEGVGWVPFEPTPGRGSVPDYARPLSSGSSTTGPDDNNGGGRDPQQQAPAGQQDNAGGAQGGSNGGVVALEWLVPLVITALAISLLPALLRTTRRRRRLHELEQGRAGPDAAWLELEDTAVDFGLNVSAAETPRAFATAVRDELQLHPDAAENLRLLLDEVERLRFSDASRPLGGAKAGARRRATIDELRAAFIRSASLGERMRAALAPASVLLRLGRGAERTRRKRLLAS